MKYCNGAALPQSGKAGGQMSHSYTYDALYRLSSATGTYTGADSKTAGYTLSMGYDNMHRITSKSQHLTQDNLQFDGTLNVGYDLTYTYGQDEGKKFRLDNVTDVNYRTETAPGEDVKVTNSHAYEYDANGNLVYVNTGRVKKDGGTDENAHERKLKWDEENRLLASDDDGFVTNYWYDADGERTVKTSGESEQVYVNSGFAGGRTNTAKSNCIPCRRFRHPSRFGPCRLAGSGQRHFVCGDERSRPPVSGQDIFADGPYAADVGLFSLEHHRHGFSKACVAPLRYDERCAQVRTQQALDVLHPDFHASAVYHVVLAPEYAEAAAVGVKLGKVVGVQRPVAYQGRVDNQAAVGAEAHADTRKRCVPAVGVRAAKPAQGYVREGLCHSVCAPHGIGETAKLLFQGIVNGSAADDEVPYAHKQPALFGAVQAACHLHGHHGGEHRRFRQPGERAARGLYADEAQPPDERTHYHHLACDIVEGHAQQGCVAGRKAEKVARKARAGLHPALLYAQRLGSAGRPACMHWHGWRTVVPVVKEILQIHFKASRYSISFRPGFLSAWRCCR